MSTVFITMTFTKRKQLQMMDQGFTEENSMRESMVDGFEFGVIEGHLGGRQWAEKTFPSAPSGD